MPLNVPASTQSFISANPGKLPLLLILATATVAYWTWRSIAEPAQVKRRQGALAALTILGFAFMDWALLALLPRLGLSFGPVSSSLALFTIARSLLFLLVLIPAVLWKSIRGRQELPSAAAARSGFASITKLGVLLLLNLILLIGEVYTMYVEPFDLRTTRLSLEGPQAGAARPLRIVHLSDLHVERTTKRERELIAQVAALQPDLILLTGDYPNIDYQDDSQTRRDTKAVLAQLSAPYGVYAVSGSIDTPQTLAYLFDGSHIRLLQDEVYRLPLESGEIYLVGVSHLGRPRDIAALSRLMAQVPAEAYSILLYHTPDLAEAAAEAKVNLYLAGHTHGGQVRLPLYGALITFSYYGKRYESGLYSIDQTTLYVSRGIGMEGLNMPRLRLLCPPEIILIDLGLGAVP